MNADLPRETMPMRPGWSSPCGHAGGGGYAGFSVHFEPVGKDGRFNQLPLLAASDLMADGYGYGAEGDTNATTFMCAGHTLIGDAHFSEMYAMDFELGSVLISHMGEGNWKVARKDRPVRLIDRPLGIGGLGNPPTAVFSAQPGPATTASPDTPRGGGLSLDLRERRGAGHPGTAKRRNALFSFPAR